MAIKSVFTTKADDKAMFGSVCRDCLAQFEPQQPSEGLGGDGGGEGGGSAGHPPGRQTWAYRTPEDFPLLVERIRRLVNRLEMRPSRRLQQTRRSRLIDLKRSARRSFRFGGAMFSLSCLRPRLRRPQIVILCDVSVSMVRHIRLTLPLLFGMAQSAKTTRAFVCAGGLEEVTDMFRQGADFRLAADWMLQHTTQVGRGTNLGMAFHALRAESLGALGTSTCLLVVSDAETVDPGFALRELRHIASRVKKVVWLNTQPRHRWPANRYIPSMRRLLRMEECSTLERAIHILRSL